MPLVTCAVGCAVHALLVLLAVLVLFLLAASPKKPAEHGEGRLNPNAAVRFVYIVFGHVAPFALALPF